MLILCEAMCAGVLAGMLFQSKWSWGGGIFCLAFCVMGLFSYVLQVGEECRVEGNCLSFRSYYQPRLIQLQISQIARIVAVNHGGTRGCEIVYANGERFIICTGPLVKFAQPYSRFHRANKRFTAAMRAANPNIVFEVRNAAYCHVCGKKMKPYHFPESLCSECGAPKPRLLVPNERLTF